MECVEGEGGGLNEDVSFLQLEPTKEICFEHLRICFELLRCFLFAIGTKK